MTDKFKTKTKFLLFYFFLYFRTRLKSQILNLQVSNNLHKLNLSFIIL